jgi:hypothetical protein
VGLHCNGRSRDTAVGIGTRLRAGYPRNRAAIADKVKRFFSSAQRLQHPDRF